jgi:hypothetical protein
MAFLEIYRREADGSFTWVAGACSVKTARAIIKSAASTPTEEYLRTRLPQIQRRSSH